MKRIFIAILGVIIIAGIVVGCGDGKEETAKQSNSTHQIYVEAENVIMKKSIYPISREQIRNGALKGMLESIDDPYSTYYTEEEAKLNRQNLASNRIGIGIELTYTSGKFIIVSAIKNTPAFEAGLAPYDELVQVNGQRVEGENLQRVLKMLQGKEGETVELVVFRPSAQRHFTFQLKRKQLNNETVQSRILNEEEGKLGYVEISLFGEGTSEDLARVLKGFEQENVQGVLFDVRDNPGGYLQAATQMLGLFFNDSKTFAYTENAKGEISALKTSTNLMMPEVVAYLQRTPIVILQNTGSASASEVFSSALSMWGFATIIGEKSFGKGTVQETWELSNGGEIKISSYKWLTLDKEWIHHKGIEPHIEQEENPLKRIQLQWITKSFQKEDFDEQIAYVQQVLQALGYTIARTDGYFDESTAEAIRQFRQNYALVIGNEIDETFLPTFYEVYRAEKEKLENDAAFQMGKSFLFNEIHKNE